MQLQDHVMPSMKPNSEIDTATWLFFAAHFCNRLQCFHSKIAVPFMVISWDAYIIIWKALHEDCSLCAGVTSCQPFIFFSTC